MTHILKQKIRRRHLLLFCVILLGIFLRTYQFRDWMTFNPDQARDAILVEEMQEGKQWPLLGPQAGNTNFKLGPIFYYFEFVSAWLFGKTADKMAYADVFFSILAIPLMYLFLKKFFEKNLSLALTFLFSISFFVVSYSRFAFNPNSIPFFSLLFLLALFEIMNSAPREKLGWAALLGIALGVGFQLHALLFLALPFLALLVLVYLFLKKQFVWKSCLMALAFFFIANTGQLFSEWKTDGANFKSFFSGASADTNSLGKNFLRDFSGDVLCHIQGYTYVVSSLGSGDKCNLYKLAGQIEKKGVKMNLGKIAVAVFGALFTIGGFMLFFAYARKEPDLRRKRAFVLTAMYSATIFLILFPVSSSISIRYFIAVEFVPFLLAGFWMRFISEKVSGGKLLLPIVLLVTLLTFPNLWAINSAVTTFVNGTASTDNTAVFGEVERMSWYLIEESPGARTIYLSGKKSYLSRYGKPLEYFLRQQDIALSKAYKTDKITASDPFFYIQKNISNKKSLPQPEEGFLSESLRTFGNVSIIKLVR